MLNGVEIRRLTWPLHNIPPFYLQKLLGCFFCMFWVIVHLYYEAPFNQLCCIWLNLGRQYIPGHFRILSTTGSHACSWHLTAPPCFTDDVVCFGSWAVPSLLHILFLPIILVQVDLNFSRSKNAFSEVVCFCFRCFLAESNLALFAPCGEPSVFVLVKSSLDCRLWQRHIYLLESVLHLAECCERVFLYHREDPPIIQHCCPPWPYRPLICCWAHQCVLFFSECTKLLIWPLLMLLQFLWFWCISFVFEA